MKQRRWGGEASDGNGALDLAAHVALGWQWCGRDVRRGPVLYLALEGGLGISERVEAFRRHHEVELRDGDVYVWPSAFDLYHSGEDVDDLVERARAVVGDRVELIVIDTWFRAMAGGDENSSVDTGQALINVDYLRQQTGAHVMVIHHVGKDERRGARGHSSLRAAADTEIQVEKIDDGIIKVEVTKQRDRFTGGHFGFHLQTVEIGHDEDGEALSSCVVVPSEITVTKKTKERSQAEWAYDELRGLIAEKGIEAPGAPIGSMTVSLDDWRERLFRGDRSRRRRAHGVLARGVRRRCGVARGGAEAGRPARHG